MSVNYAQQFSRRSTPQQQPIPGSNQVANSAGGYSWEVTPWQRMERFLILGAEGGTYYISQQSLIQQNHESVRMCIKENGPKTVETITNISLAGRAPKNDPAIFALALCVVYGDPDTKRLALDSVSKVCRIGTHLFHFVQYFNAMGKWGRSVRRAIADWYNKRDANKLAMQVIKYQQRDGVSHRDVLRLAHATPATQQHEAVFRYVVAGPDALGDRTVKGADKQSSRSYKPVARLPEVIEAKERLAKTPTVDEAVKLIHDFDLPREVIPTQLLNEIKVWDALLQKMPLTAMIRNLNKMTSIGLIKPLSEAAKLVKQRLGDQTMLRKARIHPLSVLIANRIYASGRGDKGSLTWTPVPAILQALDEAFYKTFENAVPTGKPLLFGLDVSGSMSSPMAGTCISCCEGTAALSLIHASIEPEVHVMGFADRFVDLGIRKGMTLGEATDRAQRNNFGSTDCSLAIEWAAQNKVKAGGIIIMTDSETGSYQYSDQRHPSQAMQSYRSKFVPDARLVVIGMTSNSFTINDPKDPLGLDVVGFDTSVPAVVSDFIRGRPEPASPEEVE